MPVQRMDHVGIVVDDLDAAIAFFTALGLESQGRMDVGGEWVDRIVGLERADSEIAMMVAPDGHGQLELVQFERPGPGADEAPPADVKGLRHITFTVTDLDATVDALKPFGGELIGEVVTYEDIYRLCYVRGPAGVIVELAEALGP